MGAGELVAERAKKAGKTQVQLYSVELLGSFTGSFQRTPLALGP